MRPIKYRSFTIFAVCAVFMIMPAMAAALSKGFSAFSTKAAAAAAGAQVSDVLPGTRLTEREEEVLRLGIAYGYDLALSGEAEPGQMVWISTKGGTKYHSKQTCSGMKNPVQVSLSKAEGMGLTLCKKCHAK